jgi:2,5-diamino-6-(ribosylamino)-4(3H)-pyrimidinone 5'-phosphate reductase
MESTDCLPILARHLPPREEGYRQPQPIVLDPSLRLPTDCKLLKNAMEGSGRKPVVFCGPPSVDHEMGERMFALMELGATIITLPLDDDGMCAFSFLRLESCFVSDV